MRDLQITSKGIAARGRVHDRTSGRHSNFFLENSQMKKTLAAVAVLGAFAGSAMAADVTLNGYKVGFVLENGFSGDTGAFSTDGKLFDR